MTSSLRKFALTAHITFSVGWLGAVVAYLILAIVGLASHDVSLVRAAYLSLEWIGWFVIVPFSLPTLLTGLVQSLGTQWGLFRHHGILVKFLLTTSATVGLLRHMQR
jgi:ABC-type thiamin/hydroxymethylpyrimidine transport system permease subunit